MLKKLEVDRVTKRIGFKTILAGVDLTVEGGEVLAITGPNGAGKTTLLRIIGGLARKSSGEIRWDGTTFSPGNAEQLSQIGLVGHRPMIYESMTAFDNLAFFSKMYGVYEKSRIEEALRRVGLNYYKHEMVLNFSRGMQQRLALARMLLHEPQLLLYDEPFTGLDAEGRRLLVATLQEMQAAGRVQVLITHNLDELQGVRYRTIRLVQGKVAKATEVSGKDGDSLEDCITQSINIACNNQDGDYKCRVDQSRSDQSGDCKRRDSTQNGDCECKVNLSHSVLDSDCRGRGDFGHHGQNGYCVRSVDAEDSCLKGDDEHTATNVDNVSKGGEGCALS